MIRKKKHALHESTKNFLSYEWEITGKFQVHKEELNNRRAFLIHLSLIFFFFAIGSVVISFTASIIMYML